MIDPKLEGSRLDLCGRVDVCGIEFRRRPRRGAAFGYDVLSYFGLGFANAIALEPKGRQKLGNNSELWQASLTPTEPEHFLTLVKAGGKENNPTGLILKYNFSSMRFKYLCRALDTSEVM